MCLYQAYQLFEKDTCTYTAENDNSEYRGDPGGSDTAPVMQINNKMTSEQH